MASLDITAYSKAIQSIRKYPRDSHLIDLGRVDRIVPILATAYALDIPEETIHVALQSVTEPEDLESFLLAKILYH